MIGRSVEAGDIETAARIGWDIGMYWVMRARHSEGRRLMERALDRAGDTPAGVRVRIIWPLTVCIYGSGDNELLMALSEEGMVLARQAGDREAEANMVGMTGFAALQLGDPDRAIPPLEEALALDRELGLEWNVAQILTHLSVPFMQRGDHERGVAFAREAMEITDRIGDRLASEMSLYMLGQAAWAAGDSEEASRCFRRSLAVGHEFGDVVNSAYGIIAVAVVERERDKPRRTTRMLGAAEAMLESVGVPLYAQVDNQFHLDAEKAAREELGEEAWLVARDEGRGLTVDQAVAYALEEG